MDDLSRLIEELSEELARCNAELVQMQLELERQIGEVCSCFQGADRGQVADFLDYMARARDGYSEAGDVIWRAKEHLDDYAASIADY